MDVLVRGGVVDDLGRAFVDDAHRPVGVAEVRDVRLELEARERGPELVLDVEDPVFAPPEKDEETRARSRDLAAQLAPDRAAGARHEHHLPRERFPRRGEIEIDGLPSHEILDPDIPDLLYVNVPLENLHDAGDDLEREPRFPAVLDDASHEISGGARDREDDLVHGPARRDAFELDRSPENGQSEDLLLRETRIVVEEPYHVGAHLAVRGDLRGDHPRRLAGADNQDLSARSFLGHRMIAIFRVSVERPSLTFTT